MALDAVGSDTLSLPKYFYGGPPRPKPIVIALRDRDNKRRFPLSLEPRRWTLGKAASCDIVIEDGYVSQIHCFLERQVDGEVILRDANSKNGTVVDGCHVHGCTIRPGSVIVVGKTFLVAVGRADPDSALAQLRGRDPMLRSAIDLALRAARTDASILIVGETGTGKELIARAAHEASHRAHGPYLAVNCGAFPRDLIATELFGHVRGAFTGAVEARDGLFAHADGGTLFLDELGELSMDLQPNLLRVLESKCVRPIGASYEQFFDVRVISATNRLDLLGTPGSAIRFDLYHRLATVTIRLPPLRDRKDDIPELTRAFLDELALRYGHRELRPAALEHLLAYDWPGNVRELRQTLTRAVSLTDDTIGIADLGIELGSRDAVVVDEPQQPPGRAALRRMELVERDVMAGALARCGSIRAAAKELGMPKSTFADKARRFGLKLPRDPDDE